MPQAAFKTAACPSPVIDLARLDGGDVLRAHAPFDYLVAHNVLDGARCAELRADFPQYREAGFFEHDPARCGSSINELVAAIRSPAFARAVGQKLGLPQLADKPMLVHLGFRQNRRHGTIHTDSEATLATVLFYFSIAWPHGSAGCLRFLTEPDDIDALLAPEIRPAFGTMVAFRRSDCSYHGYLPYEGERPVLKAAWLVSQAALARKTRRAHATYFAKRLLGPVDRWFDARRDPNKAHRG